jgi:hypothetical protein
MPTGTKGIVMKSIKPFLLILMLPVIGCAQSGSAPTDCAGWKPIYLTRTSIDGLADVDVTTILGHNQHGRSRGCW